MTSIAARYLNTSRAASPGTAVELEQWGGGTPLQARVRLVEPAAFTKVSALGVEEQRVNVLVDLVSPHNEWASLGEAYRLDARIEIYRKEQALTIPTGALFRAGQGWAVFTVTSGNRALQVPVAIGRRNDRLAEVLGGLSDGDRVIVYPGDSIHDGVRVVSRRP